MTDELWVFMRRSYAFLLQGTGTERGSQPSGVLADGSGRTEGALSQGVGGAAAALGGCSDPTLRVGIRIFAFLEEVGLLPPVGFPLV